VSRVDLKSHYHRPRVLCTGVQHGSSLVIALGMFVLLGALNTEPSPESFVTFGIVLIVVGFLGVVVGWIGKRLASRG
jgi:hypothetical protein